MQIKHSVILMALCICLNHVFMDRMISDPHKTKLFKEFEYIDLFPYAVALIMVLAEIYIVHQFIIVTPFVQY